MIYSMVKFIQIILPSSVINVLNDTDDDIEYLHSGWIYTQFTNDEVFGAI